MQDRFIQIVKRTLPSGVEVVRSREQDVGKVAIRAKNAQVGSAMPKLLELLSRSVTIDDDADVSHALAVHTLFGPDPDDDRGTKSYIGEVVSDAKYTSDRWSETHLAELMTEFVDSHPLFRQATHVSCPPGSSGGDNTSGLVYRLVEHMRGRLGLRFVAIQGTSREPRKRKRQSTDCSDVSGTFRISQHTAGATVLVIDDLYGHGCTVNEVVRVLRAARVSRVLALSGSKDASGCNGLPPQRDNWHDWVPDEFADESEALPFV